MSIVAREAIIVGKNHMGLTTYKWKCPTCGCDVHGDYNHDTIFEIHFDADCIDCRVKRGEYRYDGSKFVRVEQGPERAKGE